MRTASNTTDEDRVRLATRKGSRMLGPTEYQRCAAHPRRWEGYRWTWDVGSDPTSGDAEMVKACDQCEAEADEDDLD